MIVKVIGTGCTKCKTLEQRLHELKEKHKLDIEIQKVTQLNDIMAYGVMMTPGLVINEKLISVGKVPPEDELLRWIREV
jgi:small redox-active disulfide protein 2